jgi:hypothetical protein
MTNAWLQNARHSAQPVAMVDLQIAWQRIVPVSEGSDRERPTNRITNAAGTPALTREGLFTHVLQQSVGLVQDMPILGYTDERKRPAREGGISL